MAKESIKDTQTQWLHGESEYAEKRRRTRSQTLAVAATNPNNLKAERLRRGEAK